MPTVYHSSRFNSTFFTTCCRVAICDDQANCPQCKQEITPRSHRERWEVAHGPQRRQDEENARRFSGSAGPKDV